MVSDEILEGLKSDDPELREKAIIAGLRSGIQECEDKAKEALEDFLLFDEHFKKTVYKIIRGYYEAPEYDEKFLDVVSHIYMALYHRAEDKSFEIKTSLKAYAVTIAKNYFNKDKKSNKKTKIEDFQENDDLLAQLDNEIFNNYYDGYYGDERTSSFMKAFQQLNEDEQELLNLRFVDEVKPNKLPEKFGKTVEARRQKIYRTKRKLVKALKAKPDKGNENL